MKTFREYLNEYHQHQTDRVKQITYYIAIPAIIIGALILLSWISIAIAGRWHITFAWLGAALLLTYYYFLDIKLAILMTIIFILLTLLCSWIAYPSPTKLSLILFFVLFIGGWLLLFVGQTIEKTKTIFPLDLAALLMAPVFVVVDLLTCLKLGKYFDIDTNVQPTNDFFQQKK